MSKQSKTRAKTVARRAAKQHSQKGPKGASGFPCKQLAPPWVRNGTRRPKRVGNTREARHET